MAISSDNLRTVFLGFHQKIGNEKLKQCLNFLIEWIKKTEMDEEEKEIVQTAEKYMIDMRDKKIHSHLNIPSEEINFSFYLSIGIIISLTILIFKNG